MENNALNYNILHNAFEDASHSLLDIFCTINPQRGFLANTDPELYLPRQSVINEKISDLAKHLPLLLQNKHLRKSIDKLNVEMSNSMLCLDKDNKQQGYAAILMLSMLAQAYVWEDAAQAANKIPAILAKNLYALCKDKQRFPTLTYADYVLHNWQLIDVTKPFCLENLAPLLTFTGTIDEAWFIKIHVMIEAACGRALYAAYQACYLTLTFDQQHTDLLCSLLTEIADSLIEANSILNRMGEACDPDYFYSKLRTYLNGWEQVKTQIDEQQFENGVKLDGIMIKDKISTYTYRGPSGAQSSIIPALDATLGVRHDIDGMYQTLLTFQQYMPSKHRLFIDLLRQSRISEFVDASSSSKLHTAWQHAILQLSQFRASHLALVKQYIYGPAQRHGIAHKDIRGTGGSPISEYLDNRLESTKIITSDSR